MGSVHDCPHCGLHNEEKCGCHLVIHYLTYPQKIDLLNDVSYMNIVHVDFKKMTYRQSLLQDSCINFKHGNKLNAGLSNSMK